MEKTLLYLCVIALATRAAYASLKMVPEKSRLLVLEGDKLELKCIHQYENGKDNTPRSLFFMKNGEMLNGEIKTGTTVSGDLWTDTFTYTKDKADLTDTATYKCQLESGSDSSINVFVFNLPALEDVELVPGAPSHTLSCNTQEAKIPVNDNEYTVGWTHNNKTLEDGDKYKLVNDTLQILNPERDDMGEYQCLITIFPDSNIDRHIIKPKAAAVRAPPAVDSHDNNKNLVQGDDLELKCKVSGYPLPTMKWTKDGQMVNKTNKRVHLEANGGIEDGKLTIYSLDYDDEGMYSCVAANDVEPFNATGTMRLRVKDKLAALWPFLGIVAEVIILCAIILCYEKSRSKKLADEDDGTDGNVENTVDHKDVRHRRT